jgi:ABC-type uncharacterized transport system ATPase subunit
MHGTQSETTNVLEVEDLAYSFGRNFALRDVSFVVAAGNFSVLLGPNGAGKTTLMSLVKGKSGSTVTTFGPRHRRLSRAPVSCSSNRPSTSTLLSDRTSTIMRPCTA